MISALFQSEVTALETQVTQRQAQIMAAQSRITQLGEAETQAGSAIQMLSCAVSQISSLALGAISTLKSAVMGLFGSGDGSGEQPVIPPAPLPPADSDREQHDVGHAVVCREQLFAPSDTGVSDAIPADGTELTGQHSELSCVVYDAPLVGQVTELMCPVNFQASAAGNGRKPIQQSEAPPPTAAGNGNATGALIDLTTEQMQRLNWSNAQGKLCLQEHFGKNSRRQLTQHELQQFLEHLRSQPTARAPAALVLS